MLRRSRLITFGLLSFLAGVILFFPARVAYQWFAPPDLTLSGIRGSIWHGSASEASAYGIYLRELQWQIHPWQLVTAKLAYGIKSKLASGFVQADIIAGVAGTVVASDVSMSMPLSELQSVLGVPGLQGSLTAQFSEVRIERGWPVRAQGVIKIARLSVPYLLRDALGDFNAEVFTQDTAIVASLEDIDAVIDLAGSLQLSNDRSYRLLGKVGETQNTPAALQQLLSASLGAPDARRQHEFRLEGML